MMKTFHNEHHQIKTITWLRAAVLGANDGIISTASLILGVAAAHAAHASILLAGISGLVAGAMSNGRAAIGGRLCQGNARCGEYRY